ncbi:hypothetical protein SAV14893_002480 [Streptomyces avermitilis]|uniref:Uncharacterized protein n=1 Tax=Streptomyces avermitilis TaxID=33903 RepID=A0A4D4LIU6_STRAX|nr:hypothetical protein SAV14893_002480 [Streptomyces avermitilis]
MYRPTIRRPDSRPPGPPPRCSITATAATAATTRHRVPAPPAGVGRTVPGPQAAPADTPPARPPPAADAAGLESVTYEKHLFSRTSRRSPAGPKARPHKRPRAPARPATQ